MPYSAKEPANIEDLEGALAWAVEELRGIASELNETQALELRLRGQEPKKPREGMIVAASAGPGPPPEWNPGGGKGIYAYLSGTWVKLS